MANGKIVAPGVQTFAAFAAAGGAGLLALAALNLAADRFPKLTGLTTVRNYLTRANG